MASEIKTDKKELRRNPDDNCHFGEQYFIFKSKIFEY